MIEKKGNGSNFVESKYLLEENMTLLYYEGILCERPADRKKKYDLTKGDLYVIDPAIQRLKVGLGWDEARGGQNIDVDASIIILNRIPNFGKALYIREGIVSYSNLNWYDAVVHGGDNLTGGGSGDDETITIHLDHWHQGIWSQKVPVLCVVINIYSGTNNFKSIRNCFARLIDDKNKELCRFNLTEQHNTQAMIMCHIEKRASGLWGMSADGVGCSGQVASESETAAIRMLRGDDADTMQTAQPVTLPAGVPNNNAGCCCIVM